MKNVFKIYKTEIKNQALNSGSKNFKLNLISY